MRKINFIFMWILMIFLFQNLSAITYINQTDGFTLTTCSPTLTPTGGLAIKSTSAGVISGFWVGDPARNFICLFNPLGVNQTEGIGTLGTGLTNWEVMVSNGTNLFIPDVNDDWVYDLSGAGVNQSDGFTLLNSVSNFLGGAFMTNGSSGNHSVGLLTDFWFGITFQSHVNRSGSNVSDGFSTINVRDGVVTDSGFWFIDAVADYILFYDRNGNKDSTKDIPLFSVTGAGNPKGLKTNVTTGIPRNFWISDGSDNFLYHLYGDAYIPNITIITPEENNTYISNNSLKITFNFSDDIAIDSSWYSNDSYSINLSLGSGGTYFNLTNITWSEGNHSVRVYANDTFGNTNMSSTSFVIDTINPLLNITQPETGSTTANLTPLIEFSVTEINPDSLYYNITNGQDNTSAVVSTRQIVNFPTNFSDVIGSGVLANSINYVIWTLTNDSAGNTNVSYSIFTTPVIQQQSGGGGGGGSVTILVAAGNWSLTTDLGAGKYDMEMTPASSRTRGLLFENFGIEDREISLFCESNLNSTEPSLCEFVKFSENKFTLPPKKDTKLRVEFEITLPKEIEKRPYSFNIKALDDKGNPAIVTLDVKVGTFGIFTKLVSSRNIFGVAIPYFLLWILFVIFFPLLSYFTINKPFLNGKFLYLNIGGGIILSLLILSLPFV